jgi:hypothetical protein
MPKTHETPHGKGPSAAAVLLLLPAGRTSRLSLLLLPN